MPKSGPAHPIDEEWKAALAIRLRELGWTHQELADKVGVTRGAISHVVKRGIQSSLVPEIEKAIGWDTERRHRSPRVAQGTARPSREGQVSIEVMREFLGSPQQIELVTSYQQLDSSNQASVLERVRVLLEVQQRDSGKKR
jgi:hypothetical protein